MAELKDDEVRPSTRQRLNRFRTKRGYQPRTLQRVSVTRWEADADLEQGMSEDSTSSVSPCPSSMIFVALAIVWLKDLC